MFFLALTTFFLDLPSDNMNQQIEEGSKYPNEDNPYYTQFDNYRSGILAYDQSYYEINLKSPSYYLNLINQAFELSTAELQLLQQNKFIVLNKKGTDDIVDAYSYYWEKDLPIFITTDTILHLWHLVFDKILENTEENIFYPLLSALTIETMKNSLNNSLLDIYTLIYLNVALKIVNQSLRLSIPNEVEQASESLLDAILHQTQISYTPLTIRFFDDYSIYKPRGHYSKSEILKKYFRLYKWLARIPYFFDNYSGIEYLNISPKNMINSALQITWLLSNTSINYLDHYVSGLEIWDTIISFIEIIMGSISSITPRHLYEYCEQIIGDDWKLNDIDEDTINQLQTMILNDPAIPEPEMPFFINIMSGGIESPKSFTLFGEIETLDSIALQNVVHPYIENRFLPHGLDFAYTCLESNRSLELLQDEFFDEFAVFPNYQNTLESVKEGVNSYSDEKKQSLQWNWIKMLKSIAVENPGSDENYKIPEFMNSSMWLDEKLTTIMGSWAQLRHDTILFTKQSSGGRTCSTPTAFVEPYPEFYNKIGQLSQLYKISFESLKNIGYDFISGYFNFLRFLDTFTCICQRLEIIAQKELLNQPLTIEDKTFIISIYHEQEPYYCGPTEVKGWLPYLLNGLDYHYSFVSNSPNSRATLIADIHTDPNSGKVLHISTGLLEHIIAYVPSWDGTEIPMVGPVFSYYEFPTLDSYRLTDEEWRGILSIWLEKDNIESHNFDIIKRGFWAKSYMVSTDITTSIIYYDSDEFNAPGWF